MILVILSIFSFAISVVLSFSLYYNYKFGKIIVQVEDALEASLDILDERYASISEVLQTPLFYDSPQVKKVVEDLKDSRDAILYIANQIGNLEEFGAEDDNEIQEDQK